MGSRSDLPTVRKALEVLDDLEVPYAVTIASAHRTPQRVTAFVADAEARGVQVFIAAAGGAAHLAGVVAAHTLKPVIGIPLKAWATDGLDALLSTVQMPGGVPVAAVAVDGAVNAALLAARILALQDPDLRRRLEEHRRRQAAAVEEADALLAGELGGEKAGRP
ncbi:MAG: 5-(carboxyamino)imidazole ribonucleotide mutase [Bacillota bacterium]|nr:5-(carboxyamino)imidazole ribonucleotide mutase [Bacillota bacterium]REJ38216.1 MAG: 5-(carboxyamino)imidazole ribonucleotide mutase [Bacillota bacterium]